MHKRTKMMKNIFPVLLTVTFLLAGCTGDSGNSTEAQAVPAQIEPAPVIELTSEETALLEDTSVVIDESEPITRDNYEQKLKELEDALNSEQ